MPAIAFDVFSEDERGQFLENDHKQRDGAGQEFTPSLELLGTKHAWIARCGFNPAEEIGWIYNAPSTEYFIPKQHASDSCRAVYPWFEKTTLDVRTGGGGYIGWLGTYEETTLKERNRYIGTETSSTSGTGDACPFEFGINFEAGLVLVGGDTVWVIEERTWTVLADNDTEYKLQMDELWTLNTFVLTRKTTYHFDYGVTNLENRSETAELYSSTTALDDDDVAGTCKRWTVDENGDPMEEVLGGGYSACEVGYAASGYLENDGTHVNGDTSAYMGSIYLVRALEWHLSGFKWTDCGSPRSDETPWDKITMAPAWNIRVVVEPPNSDTSFWAYLGPAVTYRATYGEGHIDHDTTKTDSQTDPI
jgi:hypothetical protein